MTRYRSRYPDYVVGDLRFSRHVAETNDQQIIASIETSPAFGPGKEFWRDEMSAHGQQAAAQIATADAQPETSKPADELPDQPPAETGTKADGDHQDDEPADRPADSKSGKGKRGKGG